MNEIRQNKATKHWVILATARGKRPDDFYRAKEERRQFPSHDPGCPFCPGNENMLPSILMELPFPSTGSWRTGVISNKYPALTPEGDTRRFMKGIYVAMQGYGRHEVIIESPLHNRQIVTMSSQEVEIIIETYHRSHVDFMQEHRNMMIMIFRNHGPHAGTSLIHPHSQSIVTGMVPNHIRWKEEEAQRYFDE